MKTKIALASMPLTEPDYFYMVPKKGEINVFHPPRTVGTDFWGPSSGNNLVLIPHQERGNIKTDEVSFLQNLKVVGWDYLPEHLNAPVHVNRLKLFTSTLHQYPNDVIAACEQAGYKINKIHIDPHEFEGLIKRRDTVVKVDLEKKPETSYQPKDTAALYGRTRFLWKQSHTVLTNWEFKFVKSVGEQLSKRKALSEKQDQQLEKLFVKYNVPKDATASSQQPIDD